MKTLNSNKVKKMGEMLPFTCTSCRAVNTVDYDTIKNIIGSKRTILICGRCGRVNLGQSIKQSDMPGKQGKNYCACLPFDGPEKDLPTGYITTGGRTLWVDANGRHWTTEEFTMKYGLYPPIYWRNKTIESQAISGFKVSSSLCEPSGSIGKPEVVTIK
jgi:hypothetical protein